MQLQTKAKTTLPNLHFFFGRGEGGESFSSIHLRFSARGICVDGGRHLAKNNRSRCCHNASKNCCRGAVACRNVRWKIILDAHQFDHITPFHGNWVCRETTFNWIEYNFIVLYCILMSCKSIPVAYGVDAAKILEIPQNDFSHLLRKSFDIAVKNKKV